MNNDSLRTSTQSTNPETTSGRWISKQELSKWFTQIHSLMDHEDTINHLVKFYEIAESLGALDIEEENLYLRLFHLSHIGHAKDWYLDQSETTLTNWNTLDKKFIKRFFPYSKFHDAKTTIVVFTQGFNEALCEAWKRFKSMLHIRIRWYHLYSNFQSNTAFSSNINLCLMKQHEVHSCLKAPLMPSKS